MNRPSREDTKTAGYYKDTCPKCGAIRHDRMIGLEPTFQEWLDRMVAVCEEIKRVLRKDGTFWLNCGDAYAGSTKGSGGSINSPKQQTNMGSYHLSDNIDMSGFKPKDLLMMPARLAIALQEPSYTCKGCGEKNHAMRWGRFPNGRRICPVCEKSKGITQEAGWWLRSEIIWVKPNPMPESVTDRPTSSHEKIYLLTKSSRYFYDADAVREKLSGNTHSKGTKLDPPCENAGIGHEGWCRATSGDQKDKRNLKFPEGWETGSGSHSTLRHNQPKHTDSKMGGGGRGFNGHSGNFDANGEPFGDPRGRNLRNVWTIATQPYPEAHFATFPEELPMKCILAGTKEGDTVLDPFSGSATTGLVALKLNRRYIGIELNPDYVRLSIKRIQKEASQIKLFQGE